MRTPVVFAPVKGSQRLRQPARVERGLHGWGEPGPLGRGQPPAVPEDGEELADRPAAASHAEVRCLRRVRRGGGWFPGRFFVRFGCNHRTS